MYASSGWKAQPADNPRWEKQTAESPGQKAQTAEVPGLAAQTTEVLDWQQRWQKVGQPVEIQKI